MKTTKPSLSSRIPPHRLGRRKRRRRIARPAALVMLGVSLLGVAASGTSDFDLGGPTTRVRTISTTAAPIARPLLVVETTTTTQPAPTTTTPARPATVEAKAARVAAPATTVGQQPPPATPAVNRDRAAPGGTWDRTADCESGVWDGEIPRTNSRNWSSTSAGYQGGLHFAPSTWDRYRTAWLAHLGLPVDAQLASREQQITVAEEVLKRQGAGAWPRCSYKVGLR